MVLMTFVYQHHICISITSDITNFSIDGAITSIYSEYSECRRDRVWSFGCKDVVPSSFKISCKWSHDFVNDWDLPLVGFCDADSYLAGMYSVHDNGKEDRRFVPVSLLSKDGEATTK